MKRFTIFLLAIILSVSSLFLGACEPKKIKYLNFYEHVFGIGAKKIPLQATLYGTKDDDLLNAKDEILETLKKLNKELNTIDKESAIYKFNNDEDFAPEKKYYVSKSVYDMLKAVKELHTKTSGNIEGLRENAFKLFNPAIYPLMELWELDAENIFTPNSDRKIPTNEEIAKTLPNTDFSLVKIGQDQQGYFIQKSKKEVKIDFGGQAKGYAADLAVKICQKYNLKGATIDIGGNVYVYKSKPLADGSTQKFSVVIKMPDQKADNYFCAVRAENISFVTSGDYERNFIKNGVKYAHLLNPLTGLPVNIERDQNEIDSNIYGGLTSVTIINQSSEFADICATIVMLLGMENGIKFMKQNNLTGILISHDKFYAAIGDIDQFDHSLANGYKDYKPYVIEGIEYSFKK
ncbi:MAG TPA: FAD:protein FMN transferase [Clostridia bacterium]